MSLYCPRCDVHFEKDIPRCPGCGWDFRAHIIPEGFLQLPLDFSPLKEIGRFIATNAPLIWVNGITVQALLYVATLIIYRGSTFLLAIFMPEVFIVVHNWVYALAIVLAVILFFPIWATYLFSLLRRYRYHVPVQLFAVFAPSGRSRYSESLSWAPLCAGIALVLTVFFVVPGVTFVSIFIPFLLLMHLDKLNVSRRRRRFLLVYMYQRLVGLFVIVGFALTICWGLIALLYLLVSTSAATIAAILFVPIQCTFAVLLYESLLGREYLDSE
jgi:hypothetical protein